PHRLPICDRNPPFAELAAGHRSACWRAAELADGSLGEGGDAPQTGGPAQAAGTALPVLAVHELVKEFPAPSGLFGLGAAATVRAVAGVSFAVHRGETLGLVGESGCGKTTLARLVLRLEEPTDGLVAYDGRDLADLSAAELRLLRRDTQVIF